MNRLIARLIDCGMPSMKVLDYSIRETDEMPAKTPEIVREDKSLGLCNQRVISDRFKANDGIEGSDQKYGKG